MANAMQTNKTIRGTYGKLWVNNDYWGNVSKFEAKLAANYDDVKYSGSLATHKRLVGTEGTGTITMYKLDSRVSKLIANGFKTGNMPDIKIVVQLDDPSAYGSERIEIIEVNFDELNVGSFETGAVTMEEIPFTFAEINYIDSID